jgi:hypothetical protein
MPAPTKITHGSVQEALLLDAQRLDSLPPNSLIDAAGGLDALRQVLQMPDGFMPSGISSEHASRVTRLLPRIQQALGATPLRNGVEYHHAYSQVHALQSLLPEWSQSVMDTLPAWQRRLAWLPIAGPGIVNDVYNHQVLKQFPDYVRSEAGAIAVRAALSPMVTVADIAKRFEHGQLKEEASRAIGLTYEDGWRPYNAAHRSPEAAAALEAQGYAPSFEATATDIAQGIVNVWTGLLSQDPALRAELPEFSQIIAARLEALGIDPKRLTDSNISIPSPYDIAPFLREFMTGSEVALPGSVKPQVLVSLEHERYGRVRALLSEKRDLWRYAIQRTVHGLGKLAAGASYRA